MDYLPLFFDLKGKDCLVVGGGNIALRKIRLLTQAGARVTVVAPNVCQEISILLAGSGVIAIDPYQEKYLANMLLVVAATEKDQVNQQVYRDATAAGMPVNVVDCPALCSFIFPAIIDRSPLMIAISSGGKAPVLARMVRAKLETTLPHYYGRLAQLAGDLRDRVKKHIVHSPHRRLFWEAVFEGPVADAVAQGQDLRAQQVLEDQLSNFEKGVAPQGAVYLVGAGPGDPDLLTFKALRLMQQADVVLYDRLVSPAILDLVRRDADRISVGKSRSNHEVPQEEINQLLVTLAEQGKRVLRLKGGDPFIFGRGGEELALLAARGIPYQVVPGITAASACAASAGIPLTHRDFAQTVKFVTGQMRDGGADVNWSEFVADNQTVVFYMGYHRLAHITQNLISHGKSPDHPIALVQSGGMTDQVVITGTLETIIDKAAAMPLGSPILIIVGNVVSLHKTLAWFGTPCSGISDDASTIGLQVA